MLNKIFNYYEKEVRTIIKDGEIWFVAKDVCQILEIKSHKKALKSLDDDEKGGVLVVPPLCNKRERLLVDTLGGAQEMICVNESGLYHLIFKSRKPIAKDFRKWVTSVVLPRLRKQKFYILLSDKPTYEERLSILKNIMGDNSDFGKISEKTGLPRNIPVLCYPRSCKNARINKTFEANIDNNNNLRLQGEC